MAADVGMDWDALLQQSEELAAGVRTMEKQDSGEINPIVDCFFFLLHQMPINRLLLLLTPFSLSFARARVLLFFVSFATTHISHLASSIPM